MSGLILIIIGVVVGGWAAKANTVIESQRPLILQGSFGGLIQLICQLGGIGLIVYGVINLFS